MAIRYTVVVLQYDDEKDEAPEGKSFSCDNPVQLAKVFEACGLASTLQLSCYTPEEIAEMDAAGAPECSRLQFTSEPVPRGNC